MLRRFILNSTLALATVAAAVAGNGFSVAPASALGWGVYDSCDSPRIVQHITRRFQTLDQNVLQAGLSIQEIYDIRETGPVYTPITDVQLIPRRFCSGRAAMSDGKTRAIWFLIEGGQGFSGIGDNVEFCIAGLDPWHIYGATCRSVR